MRKPIMLTAILFLWASASSLVAAGAYVGAHVAHVDGGDVSEATTGYGLHAGLVFSTGSGSKTYQKVRPRASSVRAEP